MNTRAENVDLVESKKDLLKRVLSTIFLIGVVAVSLFSDLICGLAVSAMIGLGLYEFFNMVERKKIFIYKYFGILIGMAIPLSITFRFELTKSWELLLLVCSLVIIFILQFTRKESSEAVVGISVTLFGILYVSWLFSFLIKIKYLSSGESLVASLILITKSGDIGAYLFGRAWGRRILIARISPRKTLEGVLGGFLFCLLAALSVKSFLPAFSYPQLLFLGGFLGILAQLGDLSESLIKRDCQIKDSSNIFPGLGGILDIIDSLLFTAPAFYFFMSAIT